LALASRRWHYGSQRKGARRRTLIANPETNKETVLAFYNMAFNDKRPAEAVEKYGGEYYIQHNPQIPDGFEAFVGFVEGFTTQFPQLSVEFYHTAAEGDLVVTHSLLKTSPEDRGSAAADLGQCCGRLLPLGGRQGGRALGRLKIPLGEVRSWGRLALRQRIRVPPETMLLERADLAMNPGTHRRI
jgi:predicted SnoaL-like aldol condensation-catalyzing enzyme